MSNCSICKKELDTGTVDSLDCGGDCLGCMATLDDPDAIQHLAWAEGFKAACALLKADASGDRYGIGSMLSQWCADEVADDLNARVMEAFNART